MTPKTYCIITFGCQMNAGDSEMIAGILHARGLEPVENERHADVVLVNTCIVRGSAEDRAIGRIASLKGLKQQRPDVIVGVCGCMAQRDADRLIDRMAHVDLVLGTRAIPMLSALLDRVLAGEGPAVCTDELHDPYETGADPVRRDGLRALVTIMQGCNNWCSYCIVPAVRGRETSRPLAEILDEIERLVDSGCREVTLLGQNVNAYRDGPIDFAALLERANAVKGLARIRYMTSHPRDANKRHVAAVANLPKVCDHFHLPVQAGSNTVLERMNRGYTREHYLRLIDEVRERMPRATITTDLIVGFPGETADDFEQTMDLVERVRFDAAFTFIYNVREGTRAAEWPDDVPLSEKKARIARLIRRQEAISLEKNQARVGQAEEILVEGPARRGMPGGDGPGLVGRTTGDKCVVFEGADEDVRRLVTVRIVEAASHTLYGEKIPAEVAPGAAD